MILCTAAHRIFLSIRSVPPSSPPHTHSFRLIKVSLALEMRFSVTTLLSPYQALSLFFSFPCWLGKRKSFQKHFCNFSVCGRFSAELHSPPTPSFSRSKHFLQRMKDICLELRIKLPIAILQRVLWSLDFFRQSLGELWLRKRFSAHYASAHFQTVKLTLNICVSFGFFWLSNSSPCFLILFIQFFVTWISFGENC